MESSVKSNLWRMLYLGMLLAVLPACATVSKGASGAWTQPKTHTEPFSSFLVIAAVPRDDARSAFEMTLANAISSDGVAKARTTYGSILTKDLGRDTVVALAARTKSDVVIVTRVLDQSLEDGRSAEQVVVYYGPAVSVTHDEESNVTVVMASDRWVDVQEGNYVIKSDSLIETSVYDPNDAGRLIYLATMEAKFDVGPEQPVGMAAALFADEMVRRLRKDGVIH